MTNGSIVSGERRQRSPEAPRKAGSRLGRRNRLIAGAFMAPSMLWIGGSLLFAIVLLIAISLRDVKLGRLGTILEAPVTLTNYIEVALEQATWRSFWISLIYVVGSTAIPFLIGLFTAILLNNGMPARRLMRTLALVPWAVPSITATVAFVWILQPTYGVWNYFLRSVGLIDADINWFGNPDTAIWAVIIPTSWKSVPFFTLMLLAGLQSISRELYEAASVDGAGSVGRFRWVTLPGLAPFILVSIIFSAMHSFREFDFIYASTRGGPDGATETTAVRIFNEAFESFDFGNAATLGVITFVVVAILVVLIFRRSNKGALEGFL